MINRYLARRKKANAGNKHGTVSEQKAIKKLGAILTPGSGSMDSAKSDGYDAEYQYENKSTTKQSFGLKLSVLKKIIREAREVGRTPILLFSFVTGSGKSVGNGDYVVMTREDFEALRDGDHIDS